VTGILAVTAKDFDVVRRFLAHPSNEELLERYEEAACECNEQIVAHKSDFASLDRALIYLNKLLSDRDGDLARHKRLTKLVVYYMYWNCDIGEDDSTC
jgi:hypothetical protein